MPDRNPTVCKVRKQPSKGFSNLFFRNRFVHLYITSDIKFFINIKAFYHSTNPVMG
jgi:hypothetical protein